MRPNVGTATRASTVATAPVSSRGVPSTSAASVRSRLNLAGFGFLLYLWVVHSGKAPIGAAAIGLGLVGLFLQRERLRVPGPLIWFAAFLLWAGLGYFTAESPDVTAQALLNYTKIGLIFLLALNVAHSRNQFRWMMIAWLGIFALYPVRGTLFNIAFGITTMGRYAWNFIFSNPNDLTTLTIPILAMAVAMLQSERERWVRICALAGVIVLPMVMVATQSRGGILALFLFGALVLFQYRRRMGAILLGLMILGAVIQLAPPGAWERLGGLSKVRGESTLSAADPWGSAEQRYDIWRVARAITEDHPLLGVGVGGYSEAHRAYAATGRFQGVVGGKRDPHSTFIGTAAETGLVGLGLFLGMLVSVFRTGWRAVHRLQQIDPRAASGLRTLLFGLIAFLQACLFATVTHIPFLYLYIAVICTMIAIHLPPSERPASLNLTPRTRG